MRQVATFTTDGKRIGLSCHYRKKKTAHSAEDILTRRHEVSRLSTIRRRHSGRVRNYSRGMSGCWTARGRSFCER